jgi:tRNA 5-methylaminomethyl-2-thiouridine biosynthesis bifunctional protein
VTEQPLLHQAGLPQAWQAQSVWRLLDTRFSCARLLAVWQAWRLDAQRPRVLHYVALMDQPPAPAALLQAAGAGPQQRALARELLPLWHGLQPGFHRLSLAQGQLQLTLCIGELQPLLREQKFEADTVFFDTMQDWDRWSAKALARCCRRGTALACASLSPAVQALLAHSGFEVGTEPVRFHPRWELKTSREPLRTRATPPGRCVVVGAGLAGASVAATLARRGWDVTVLDAAPQPAAGASGLPAGLVVPHVSGDDSPRSRLSRAGVRLMLQEARRLLTEGQDWAPSGVLERRLDGHPGLPSDWSDAGCEISRPAPPFDAAPWHAGCLARPELWHTQAAWIKPARLVQAWLAQPEVRFGGLARVESLRRKGTQWQLLDREGALLAEADQVVLANAGDAMRLLAPLRAGWPGLAQLPAVHDMRGVLTSGLRPSTATLAALPPFPVNGLGSLIPAVPVDDEVAWYAGATYEAADVPPAPAAEHHRMNLEKLRTLLPMAAQALAPAFEPAAARGWGNTRCVSADRLPLLGPLEDGEQPTLWISAAMGSRGLSFAVLCAELLAARLGAEPWPLEASLARFLHARRRAAPAGS